MQILRDFCISVHPLKTEIFDVLTELGICHVSNNANHIHDRNVRFFSIFCLKITNTI